MFTKYLIISLFFTIFANAQLEYDVYRFPSVTPEYIVRSGFVYKVDKYFVPKDIPDFKIEDNYLYEVDEYGIINYEQPITIETWENQQIYNLENKENKNNSETWLLNYLKQRGNYQTETTRLRDF